MSITLRQYQEDAIAASIDSPLQRQLIVLSTGLGKTITALSLAKKLGHRTLWLAHTEELVTQPERACEIVWPEVSRGIVKAENNQYMRHIVFASIQSAQQEQRLKQLVGENFRFVVVDEAHHALSEGYKKVLSQLGCFGEGGPKLLGLTATPERTDNQDLADVFDGIVFHMGISSAIEGGYLVKPNVVKRTINVDLDDVTITRGDYGQRQLDLALMEAGIIEEIVSGYKEHCIGRKAIIFVISVSQAEAVAESLRKEGFPVACVSGNTEAVERKRILKALKNGEIKAVVNCMVLTEGFDEPSVDCIILARPTQSKPLMIQMIGRGLRLMPGKQDCLVMDMVGLSKKNTLIQAAVLLGIEKPPTATKEQTKSGLIDPQLYWEQRYKTQIEGVQAASRSKLNWIPGQNGSWLLQTGDSGTLCMTPVNDDIWDLFLLGQKDQSVRTARLNDRPVSIEIAQALAEDYVRRMKAIAMANNDARWRDLQATQKQIDVLAKSGFDTSKVTRGLASDILTQLMAQKNLEPASKKQIFFLRRHGRKISNDITKREACRLIAQIKQS